MQPNDAIPRKSAVLASEMSVSTSICLLLDVLPMSICWSTVGVHYLWMLLFCRLLADQVMVQGLGTRKG